MHRRVTIVLIIMGIGLLGHVLAQPSPFNIKAARISVGGTEKETRRVSPSAVTKRVDKKEAYTFTIKNMSGKAMPVEVSWKLYRECATGRLLWGGEGNKSGTFAPGRTVKLTTEPVLLRSENTRSGNRMIIGKNTLEGYALVIKDKDGKVLMEKFSSSRIKAVFKN